jgi:hypothetical protein
LIALLLAVATISSIDVQLGGVDWTSRDAILRLMSTRVGDPLDEETLERDLARLRSTGILYDVSAHAFGEGRHLEVDAKDRWSLMPTLSLRRGGGRTLARVGATDHNALARLFTVHGEISSNADVPFSDGRFGSYVFAEVPRFFGTRLQPGIYWTRDFIDFAAYSASGKPGYAYERRRHDVRFELRYELSNLLSLSAGGDVLHDRYITSTTSSAPGAPPPAVDKLAAVAGVQLGFVEQLVSQSRGRELKLELELARASEPGGTPSAVGSVSVTARGYFVPREGHNLCMQLILMGTTGRTDTFLFRSGGLRELRGFTDAYFQGQLMARVNLEHRIDVFRHAFVMPAVVQAAAFVDSGWVARRAGAVAGASYEGPIASAGIGGRYIPIPLANVVARVDFAMGLAPRRTFDLSISGQQFF